VNRVGADVDGGDTHGAACIDECGQPGGSRLV
jgi:hypothetical protein